jgi:hypothetical protein
MDFLNFNFDMDFEEKDCHEYTHKDECNKASSCVYMHRVNRCLPKDVAKGIGWIKHNKQTKQYFQEHDINAGTFRQGKNFTKTQIIGNLSKVTKLSIKILNDIFSKFIGGKEAGITEKGIKLVLTLVIFALLFYVGNINVIGPSRIVGAINSPKAGFIIKSLVVLIKLTALTILYAPVNKVINEFVASCKPMVVDLIYEVMPFISKSKVSMVVEAFHWITCFIGMFSIDKFLNNILLEKAVVKMAGPASETGIRIAELFEGKKTKKMLEVRSKLLEQHADALEYKDGRVYAKINVTKLEDYNKKASESIPLYKKAINSVLDKLRLKKDNVTSENFTADLAVISENYSIGGLRDKVQTVEIGKLQTLIDAGEMSPIEYKNMMEQFGSLTAAKGMKGQVAKFLAKGSTTGGDQRFLENFVDMTETDAMSMGRHIAKAKKIMNPQAFTGEETTMLQKLFDFMNMMGRKTMGLGFGVGKGIFGFASHVSRIFFVMPYLQQNLPNFIHILYKVITGMGSLVIGRKSLKEVIKHVRTNSRKQKNVGIFDRLNLGKASIKLDDDPKDNSFLTEKTSRRKSIKDTDPEDDPETSKDFDDFDKLGKDEIEYSSSDESSSEEKTQSSKRLRSSRRSSRKSSRKSFKESRKNRSSRRASSRRSGGGKRTRRNKK